MTGPANVNATDRVNGEFLTGHDRLDDLREILGIIPPRAAQVEPDPVTPVDVVQDPAVHQAASDAGASRTRTIAFDLKDPAVVLLVVFWTAFLGLLAASITAMG